MLSLLPEGGSGGVGDRFSWITFFWGVDETGSGGGGDLLSFFEGERDGFFWRIDRVDF